MEIGTVRVSPKNTTGCPYRTLIIQDDTVICLQGDYYYRGRAYKLPISGNSAFQRVGTSVKVCTHHGT